MVCVCVWVERVGGVGAGRAVAPLPGKKRAHSRSECWGWGEERVRRGEVAREVRTYVMFVGLIVHAKPLGCVRSLLADQAAVCA